uniref:OTU domain-containing protein n=1 Tax=Amphimedon queenslandica TaxID=400682 RepID=A0A1X7VCH0_AMPQE
MHSEFVSKQEVGALCTKALAHLFSIQNERPQNDVLIVLVSDCLIDKEKTKGASNSKVLHKLLPPASTNRDWVQKAVAIISKLSGIAVVQHFDAVKQVPGREIATHIQDEIVVDGACFFRTISKAITATEDNHFAV